ncbi:CLUMA_CG011006, isoform A [Clunio marinus]|uniref:CLUMA_CG011006, isoform A n=1 Tax=Clunio marinus TaxID=568069 RepID=A0A1J1IDI6_9DIPT|nr:CLUMA_CG011006, isoform A [Clunio marinus]
MKHQRQLRRLDEFYAHNKSLVISYVELCVVNPDPEKQTCHHKAASQINTYLRLTPQTDTRAWNF